MNFNEIVEFISSAVFGSICHQNTSSLVYIGGKMLLLCPRCTGLHTGFFLCIFYTLLFNRERISLTGQFVKIFCATALVFIFTEWLFAQFNITHSTTESRYTSGLLAGCALGLLTLAYCSYYLYFYRKKRNTAGYQLIILFTLIAGIGLSQLTNWTMVTLLLLLTILFNLTFILYIIIARMRIVFSKNQKNLLP